MSTAPFFHTFTGGIAATNGYFLPTAEGGILIDAPEGVTDWLSARGFKATHLLLTHQHFDHVMDAALLQDQGCEIHAFSAYNPSLTLENIARSWGMPDVAPYSVDHLLDPALPLSLAGMDFSLAHVPGHSPDSVTFYLAEYATLFSGDTLFQQSIGRTDIPNHGDERLLLQGIHNKLLTLPAATSVYPGHGGSTTIAHEIRSNPYLS